MKVGVPTEIKPDECPGRADAGRGARTRRARPRGPGSAWRPGKGSASRTRTFETQRARIVPAAEDVFDDADLVLKVKEPQREEVSLLRPETTSCSRFLHLAPAPDLTRGLCESGATCVAYETVEDAPRAAAAAGADERDRRQDRHPGGRLHAREAARRARHPARRRARSGLGQRDDRRRRGRSA